MTQQRNFDTLDVGRTYENGFGGRVAIVGITSDKTYPFQGKHGTNYTAQGAYESQIPSKHDLIRDVTYEVNDPRAQIEALAKQHGLTVTIAAPDPLGDVLELLASWYERRGMSGIAADTRGRKMETETQALHDVLKEQGWNK